MSHRFVLAAIDLDVSTGIVLETALRETLARPGAELLVFYAFEFLGADLLGLRGRQDAEKTIEELKLRTHQALQAYAVTHKEDVLPRTEVQMSVGRPAQEIVWAAAHYDVELIVVGSHGRRGVGRLLMGSVAEKVVRLAGCPVTVVREKQHDPRHKLAEIEPLCPACAEVRATSGGATLWCARHSEHHIRAHVYSSAGRTESPSAWSSSSGT
ncbi:MAG: universal stress protein [Polyangiaceae bacterium]